MQENICVVCRKNERVKDLDGDIRQLPEIRCLECIQAKKTNNLVETYQKLIYEYYCIHREIQKSGIVLNLVISNNI